MSIRLKDISSAIDNLNHAIDRKNKEQGKIIANNIIHGTRNGRGVWLLLLWPSLLAFLIYLTEICVNTLTLLHINNSNFFGFLIALVLVIYWYYSNYTKNHPFYSVILMLLFISVLPSIIRNSI